MSSPTWNLRIGQPAPAWKGIKAAFNGEIKPISLQDYKGKYLVMVFYPLDFTFVCPTEVLEFSARIEEFKKLNTDVVGISIDSEYAHLAWIASPKSERGLGGSLNFPLLADINKEICNAYQVLNEEGVALRGTFIIDKEGKLRYFAMNDNSVGRSVDEVLRLLQAVQFVDQTGGVEVCPINWKPGQKVINKPKYQEYFKA